MVQFSSGKRKEVKESESSGEKASGSELKKDKPDYLENAYLIADSINNNTFLNSNRLFENLTQNFKLTKKLLGARFLEKLTGYNDKYIKKNINIPEFQKELKERIDKKIKELKEEKLIDEDNKPTDMGIEKGTMVLISEELNKLINISGEFPNKKSTNFGIVKDFSQELPKRFTDIALKKTIRVSIRRGHRNLEREDLRKKKREDKSAINIIYALDSSGSMKGEKLREAKKAGIALIYKALKDNNKVGLVLFQNKVIEQSELGSNFKELVKKLVSARPKQQTSIEKAILRSLELLKSKKGSSNIFLITDAMPTEGEAPIKKTMDAVFKAAEQKVRISIIGIDLKDKGKELARQITEATNGRLYFVNNMKDFDILLLSEYEEITKGKK